MCFASTPTHWNYISQHAVYPAVLLQVNDQYFGVNVENDSVLPDNGGETREGDII